MYYRSIIQQTHSGISAPQSSPGPSCQSFVLTGCPTTASATSLSPLPVVVKKRKLDCFLDESYVDDADDSVADTIDAISTTAAVNKPCKKVVELKYVIKKRQVVKTKDDEVPLPDPFELPKNYRPDVELALKSQKMTMTCTREFLSTVAGAMYERKKYPTKDDFMNVARSICKEYPFMKAPTAKPYVRSVVF